MFETLGHYIGVGAEAVAIASVGFAVVYLTFSGPLHWLGIYDPPMTCGAYNERGTGRAVLIGLSKLVWLLAILVSGVTGVLATIGYVVEVLL